MSVSQTFLSWPTVNIFYITYINTHIHRIKTFHTKILYLLCVMNSDIFSSILLYSFILKNYCDSLNWFYIMLLNKDLKSEKWFLRSEVIKLISERYFKKYAWERRNKTVFIHRWHDCQCIIETEKNNKEKLSWS